MRRDRDHVTAIEDNPSSEGNDDPHDESSALRSVLPRSRAAASFNL